MADEDKVTQFINELKMNMKEYTANDLIGAHAIGVEQGVSVLVDALEQGWLFIEGTQLPPAEKHIYIEGFKSALEMAYIMQKEAQKATDEKITPATKKLR